jgi:hypothetical protein
MRRLAVLFFLVFAAALLNGQANEWQWGNTTYGIDEEWGYSIARDNLGNTYVTGIFMETAWFGTHYVTSLTSWPNYNIFVAKLNPAGEWEWAVSAGGPSHSNCYSIAVDEYGAAYITGFFYDVFYAGGFAVSSVGECDAFFAKLDTDGYWMWLYRGGGVLGADIGHDVAIDPIGLVHFIGEYYGTATFYTQTLESNGNNDAFIVTIGTEGTWIGASTVGGTNWDEGFGIAVDQLGDIVITGRFMGEMTLGGDTIQAQTSTDIFVARRSGGSWLWLRRAGGGSHDFGEDVVLDGDGNTYLTGGFSWNAVFGPHTLYASGAIDVFVAKLDIFGTWEWASGGYGGGEDYVRDIGMDAAGNIYIAGYMVLNLSFGYQYLSSAGDSDGFIACIDPDGQWEWAHRVGDDYMDSAEGIAVDAAGNIYATGYFQEFLYLGDFFFTDDGVGTWAGKYGPGDDTLPVELSSFTVTAGSGLSALLEWTTQSETDLLGFNILRHTEEDLSQAATLNPFLISDGVPLGSQTTYRYQDLELEPGATYHYWLQSVDLDGGCEYFGPLSYHPEPGGEEGPPPLPPLETRLLPPYPNPFNPRVFIPLMLSEPATIQITVCNARGQVVKRFPASSMEAGYHQLAWDGSSDDGTQAPTGVYLLRARIAGKEWQARMVLMK